MLICGILACKRACFVRQFDVLHNPLLLSLFFFAIFTSGLMICRAAYFCCLYILAEKV